MFYTDTDEAYYSAVEYGKQSSQKEIDALVEALGKLTCYVNAVTVFHRHGSKIPKQKLDNLCNEQLTAESVIRLHREEKQKENQET